MQTHMKLCGSPFSWKRPCSPCRSLAALALPIAPGRVSWEVAREVAVSLEPPLCSKVAACLSSLESNRVSPDGGEGKCVWLASWARLESRGLLRRRELNEHVFTLYLAFTASLISHVGNPGREKCSKGEAKAQTGEVPSRRPCSEAHGCPRPHCVPPVYCSQPAGQLGTVPWVTL